MDKRAFPGMDKRFGPGSGRLLENHPRNSCAQFPNWLLTMARVGRMGGDSPNVIGDWPEGATMQTYVQTARQKKSIEDLLEYLGTTVPGTPANVAANAEVKRRELMAQFEIIALQKEALNIQNQAAEGQREALDIQTQAAESQRDAAIETQRTAEYTKENARYMKWSVIVLAIASICNLVVGVAGLFIHH
jgi:hypothetical protein